VLFRSREIEEWLEAMEIDTGWIFYEELQQGQYEALEQDSKMLQVPIALQRADRPTFPLYSGVCLDGLVQDRLTEALLGVQSPPCTSVLAISALATPRDAVSTFKLAASEGKRTLSSYNVLITACDKKTEFRGTVHLRGSTDWGEFINLIIKTCIDNKCMPHWTARYMDQGHLSAMQEPTVYIMAPYLVEHSTLAPIIYNACIDPKQLNDQYAPPTSNAGLPQVSWSDISQYVPVDQWLPLNFRDWGILVVVPSTQDAPFRRMPHSRRTSHNPYMMTARHSSLVMQ
jgi:hypothetical protein